MQNSNWKATFSVIFAGQTVSILTRSVVSFSIILWISIETGSTENLSFAMLANITPAVLLGFFSGVYVDRWDKLKTLILSDVFVALCTFILFVYICFFQINILLIIILLIPRAIGNTIHTPTMQASIPLIVPKANLMQIAGLNQISGSLCNILGPFIAALLITNIELKYILLIDILGSFVACMSLFLISFPRETKNGKEKNRFFNDLKEGLNSVFFNKTIRYMFYINLTIVFFISPLIALLPLFTINYFQTNASGVSLVQSFWCMGIMIGGILLGSKFLRKREKPYLIIFNSLMMGVLFFISGLIPSSYFYLFIAIVFVAGISYSIFNSAFLVLLQTLIKVTTMGRVFSSTNALLMLPSIPSLCITAYLGDNIDINLIFLICGISICIITPIFLLRYNKIKF